MEDTQTFAHRVEECLEAKRERLDRVELVKLKESFKLFQSSFQGIRTILDKKGILHEDPYKYELKISEVANPPEGPFPESEKLDQMSIRVSQFESYLDFLNNYYQFSTDFLAMGRIKRLLALTKYFNFMQFSDTSTQLNTRALAELLNMVKKGSDQFSSGILAEALGQLDRASRDILAALKELTIYHKERYKLELRQLVMPGLAIDTTFAITHRDETIRQVKRKFAEVAGERPFYPELVDEVLREDYSSDGPSLRDALLARIEVKEEKKTARDHEKSFRGVLMDGARALAGAAFSLEDALAKLQDNSAILEARNQSFSARFRRMIRKLFFPEDQGLVYKIEVLDPVSNQRKAEDLDFGRFVEEMSKRASLLASLAQRNGPAMKRMESMPEDQSYKFLQRNIEELQRMLRILSALDEFFKEETPEEDLSKLKGIKVELTTIKGAVIKANQKKHEYVAQREELEQMKRLGIQDPAP
jgi:hypothetical protein